MKNYLIIPALVAISFIGCKEKKEAKQEPPISALSIIKGQINRLDTSLYGITKYETTGNFTDTVYLKREEIRKFAAPFLSLPEIADKKYYENYTEERLIDAQQETLSITATAKNENAEIQKQIIIIIIACFDHFQIVNIYFIKENSVTILSFVKNEAFAQMDPVDFCH